MSETRSESPADLVAEVAVVGGGIAGLTLACALGTAGVGTVCIDRDSPEVRTDEGFDGRTTAIAYGSQQVMAGAGVWPRLAPDAGPILEIRVADDYAPLFLHYDHREVGDRPFGYIVENRAIRRGLFARLAELPSVAHLAPAEVDSIERSATGAVVALKDGRRVRAQLVVGADGRGSLCRRTAGIPVATWKYRQVSIACTIAHELPHHGIALEHFFPSGPFAVLPMTGDRSSIVWSEREDLAPGYLKLDDAAFARELRRRIGEWLGEVRPIGRRFAYPLSLMHAERYVDRRLALVGEAAHAIHPIAGQGLNMGLRDVAALAESVVDARRLGLDVGSAEVLERYQRWRRFDNVVLVGVTDLLNRLFSNDLGPVKLARDLGLAAVGGLPPLRPLKRFFMRHAMGVVGELPRLARGEPL